MQASRSLPSNPNVPTNHPLTPSTISYSNSQRLQPPLASERKSHDSAPSGQILSCCRQIQFLYTYLSTLMQVVILKYTIWCSHDPPISPSPPSLSQNPLRFLVLYCIVLYCIVLYCSVGWVVINAPCRPA